MIFDSHAHLDDDRFFLDRDYVCSSLKKNGVAAVINAGSDIKSSKRSLQLAEKYNNIYAVCGIHPQETENISENDIFALIELLKNPKCVGIGEIGLDYYYPTPEKSIQKKWFERQLAIAKEFDLPVVIHDREAHAECFEAVKKFGVKGVFHCYSGSAEMAKELVKIGFYVAFGGVITFKNAKKSIEAAEVVPLDRILIETDCPYLAPVPYRGRRNEPRLTKFTAEKIAEIKGLSTEQIEDLTLENTCNLYNIKRGDLNG